MKLRVPTFLELKIITNNTCKYGANKSKITINNIYQRQYDV
jgi:hypothetical protein